MMDLLFAKGLGLTKKKKESECWGPDNMGK